MVYQDANKNRYECNSDLIIFLFRYFLEFNSSILLWISYSSLSPSSSNSWQTLSKFLIMVGSIGCPLLVSPVIFEAESNSYRKYGRLLPLLPNHCKIVDQYVLRFPIFRQQLRRVFTNGKVSTLATVEYFFYCLLFTKKITHFLIKSVFCWWP